MFSLKRFPFVPQRNEKLKALLLAIVAGCSASYDNIDLERMEELYGFAADSEVPAAAVDCPDLSRADSEDEVPCGEGTVVDSALIQCASEDDPCIVKGFLSEPGGLVKLWREHARCGRLDKAEDQFEARRNQEVCEGGRSTTNRRVGSLSTTGSLFSSSNSPGVPGPSASGTSSESKKRVRPEEAAKVTEAEERGAKGMVRRSKRSKAMQEVDDD